MWVNSHGFPPNRLPQLGVALLRKPSATVYWMRTCDEHSWPSSYEVLREPLHRIGDSDKYTHDGWSPDELNAVGLSSGWNPVRVAMRSGFNEDHRLDIWLTVDCTTFPKGA